MSALLDSLILKYGEPIARKLLGLDKQSQNPKYAISLGGMNLNPMNMIKRAGINQGIKSLTGGKLGGMLGPGLLLGGAMMLGRAYDPTRKGSKNYNPYLQGQIDYASGRGFIGINPASGLGQYSDKSVLSGQNVKSLFGTNDYVKQLNNYKDKYYDKMSDKRKDKLDREIDSANIASQGVDIKNPNEMKKVSGGNNNVGGGNNNYGGATQSGGFDRGSFEQDGTGRQGYNRGGIASL